ncbi:hypothetical protein F4777DRAFT_559830 [Nemania sp. FL0916]|nr:hypothetical protein F4777DRAFT_559830 [Nemania sp. FL0916]
MDPRDDQASRQPNNRDMDAASDHGTLPFDGYSRFSDANTLRFDEVSPTVDGGTSRNDYDSSSWYLDYDFIVDPDHGELPYWRLKPHLQPRAPRPARINAMTPETAMPHHSRSTTDVKMYSCLYEHCGMSFRRRADLERHCEQIHKPKDSFRCDRRGCHRGGDAPFQRRDHYRDHLREFHLEDLVRRKPSESARESWWQTRNINTQWWRCTRCLTRVNVEKDGYTCSACNTTCEEERQRHRAAMKN